MNGAGPFAGLVAELERLDPERRVLVQPHDFPDHDAVAASFGLAQLLERQGFRCRILHRGRIRSFSLLAMVREFEIPLERVREQLDADLENWPCIIIDGNPEKTNALPLSRVLAGIVDHHLHSLPPASPWADLRTSCGSCAAIVADYWEDCGVTPDRPTATALLMGIQMDTDFLSRGVSPTDLAAFNRLFFVADWEFGARIIKTSLSLKDLPAIALALSRSRTKGRLFFTDIPSECSQEFISIVADFFLRLKEIDATVIVEAGSATHHVSIRCRRGTVSAAELVQHALDGLGKGGGHDHMAGGAIAREAYPGADALFKRFINAFEACQEHT